MEKTLAIDRLIPVFLSRDEIRGYYEDFACGLLWPVLHDRSPDHKPGKYQSWHSYQSVNQKFKDAVLTVAAPGDFVWIHDYHLLLLPALIRKALPGVRIGFFLHTPFPSFKLFNKFPYARCLLSGMLGADIIGFHTLQYEKNFLTTALQLLPVKIQADLISFDDRILTAGVFPMGINEDAFKNLALEKKVQAKVGNLQRSFNGSKLILSVDRLDYTKGILQRLQAFEQLLLRHPVYRCKITMQMVVAPSRDNIPRYAALRNTIDKKVDDINNRYREIDWTPVHYYYGPVSLITLSALYSLADICLVTSLRDGMNLVSKEYVASRLNNDGVLILSEMAGASQELAASLTINPNRIDEICSAIITAINMPLAEQQARMIKMRKQVAEFDIHYWVRLFMEKLSTVAGTLRLP